jgi:hypothetical protein
VPRLSIKLYPGIRLTTEKNHGKTSVGVAENRLTEDCLARGGHRPKSYNARPPGMWEIWGSPARSQGAIPTELLWLLPDLARRLVWTTGLSVAEQRRIRRSLKRCKSFSCSRRQSGPWACTASSVQH